MEMYKTEWKLLKSSIAMDDPYGLPYQWATGKFVVMEVKENTCRPKLRSAIEGFFNRQPCLLCAGLVTSYLSKWSTGTSCKSFCKNR